MIAPRAAALRGLKTAIGFAGVIVLFWLLGYVLPDIILLAQAILSLH
jgi:hypothetical protein